MDFSNPLLVSSDVRKDRAKITAVDGMLEYSDGETVNNYSHSIKLPKLQSSNPDDVKLEKEIDDNKTRT